LTETPRLATWLLQRFGVSESVVGDLVERFQTKPSVVWFWRQSLTAVRIRIVADINTHRLSAIGAIVAGCTINWVLLFVLRTPVRTLGNMTGRPLWNWTIENGFDGLRALWFGYGGHGRIPVLVYVTLCIASAVTGWTVSVLHRSVAAVMVTAYAASTPILMAVWLQRESDFVRLSSSPAFYTIYLLLVIPLCALFGGLCCSRPPESREPSIE
jgi:hypothetical protein